jgi:hypothetical protein
MKRNSKPSSEKSNSNSSSKETNATIASATTSELAASVEGNPMATSPLPSPTNVTLSSNFAHYSFTDTNPNSPSTSSGVLGKEDEGKPIASKPDLVSPLPKITGPRPNSSGRPLKAGVGSLSVVTGGGAAAAAAAVEAAEGHSPTSPHIPGSPVAAAAAPQLSPTSSAHAAEELRLFRAKYKQLKSEAWALRKQGDMAAATVLYKQVPLLRMRLWCERGKTKTHSRTAHLP